MAEILIQFFETWGATRDGFDQITDVQAFFTLVAFFVQVPISSTNVRRKTWEKRGALWCRR